ncbi:MAG: UDP-N-acetylmuramoyl-L-alanyl-D-glutamate--2,6-diaminopimelate ligase, partial [Lachnospiraceae bacterium]|nr:UDP-N-acetylmuramoyl-L-alanyl-D-glutamate--2,6-diaminopimelate ligase [Lachnospiraceae bacterium]
MRLSELLAGMEYKLLQGSLDTEVTALVYDSRKVEKGCAFVCLKGAKFDGHAFAAQAVSEGAATLLVEDEAAVADLMKNAGAQSSATAEAQGSEAPTVILVENTREALAYAAKNWFGNPASKLKVIGLTGTKGKTTTTHMIKKILEEAGNKVGMIGTLGAFIGEEKFKTANTTPESYELQRLFAKMLEEGCTYAVMEVSSQALKLGRTAGIEFAY